MQNRFKWDDLAVLAALVRERTLSGAAARLGVNASTVGRRLDALEEALDAHLFDRTPEGVHPTAAAEQLFPIAEQFEDAAAEVMRAVEGFETEPEGTVRITAPPGVASQLVAPLTAELLQAHPRIRVELDASVGYADLTRREADIALRLERPRSGDLIATRLGTSTTALVASSEYATDAGRVRSLDELRWIDWGPGLSHLPDSRWLNKAVSADRIVLRTDSIDAQVAAARAGVGALLLPRAHAGLVDLVEVALTRKLSRSLPPLPESSLWLVGHRALRHVPRVAVVWEFLVHHATREMGSRR
jgi:DNA-binding transcriptional LysR family regulator